MKYTLPAVIALLITLLSGTQPSLADTQPATATALEKSTHYVWELGQQSLINTEQAGRNLLAQVELFLAEPGEASLAQTRQEWRNSHQQWQQHALWLTLAQSQQSRFSDLHHRYFLLDARELQPGYLDAVADYPFSGIVNDISIVLTADNLRQQHGLTDNSEVSLGFHALEFLLWGEQGLRSFTDFQAIATINNEQNAAGLTTGDLANNRRRTLLRLISQLLADDLQRLRQDWQNPESSISLSYLQLSPEARLAALHKTVHQSLAHEIPAQLQQLLNVDRSTHHNQFAGDTYQHILAQLNGMETVLTSGEQPLVHWLAGSASSVEWQQQLRLQISSLNEINNDKGEADQTKLTGIQEQLRLLANTLANPVLENTNE